MRLFFIGSDAGKIRSVLFCVQLGAHAAQAAVQVPPDQRFNGIQVFFPDHPQNFPVLAQHIRHIVGPHHIQTGKAGIIRLRLCQVLLDIPLVHAAKPDGVHFQIQRQEGIDIHIVRVGHGLGHLFQ